MRRLPATETPSCTALAVVSRDDEARSRNQYELKRIPPPRVQSSDMSIGFRSTAEEALDALVLGAHDDPFALLGPHAVQQHGAEFVRIQFIDQGFEFPEFNAIHLNATVGAGSPCPSAELFRPLGGETRPLHKNDLTSLR